MPDIYEFLIARQDEEWKDAQEDHTLGCQIRPADAHAEDDTDFDRWRERCTCKVRKRLLDITAKRRILARHKPADPKAFGWAPRWCEGCRTESDLDHPFTEDIDDCPELRDLASAHETHADYLKKWQPTDG